jgi:hypothetical protein
MPVLVKLFHPVKGDFNLINAVRCKQKKSFISFKALKKLHLMGRVTTGTINLTISLPGDLKSYGTCFLVTGGVFMEEGIEMAIGSCWNAEDIVEDETEDENLFPEDEISAETGEGDDSDEYSTNRSDGQKRVPGRPNECTHALFVLTIRRTQETKDDCLGDCSVGPTSGPVI